MNESSWNIHSARRFLEKSFKTFTCLNKWSLTFTSTLHYLMNVIYSLVSLNFVGLLDRFRRIWDVYSLLVLGQQELENHHIIPLFQDFWNSILICHELATLIDFQRTHCWFPGFYLRLKGTTFRTRIKYLHIITHGTHW